MNLYSKSVLIAFIFSLVESVAFGQTAHDLTLKVSDDNGRPLAGAQVMIKFLKIGGEDRNTALTDEKGEFRAQTELSLGTFLRVEKSAHYTARLDNLNRFHIPTGKATMAFVLPRIVQPIALHALRVGLTLPEQGKELGYDLAVADWVSPYGKGQTADIQFKYRNEFKGYRSEGENLIRARELSRTNAERRGEFFSEEEFKKSAGHWQGELQISFPGPKEGIVEETARYWYYSELHLPHHAPENGYEQGKYYKAQTMGYRQPDKLVGYFLRTRVKLNAHGDIISANFAKIYEDIRFDARGTVSFWYYYNPTPNDRNLEFDPSRNLFPSSMNGANIANP